MVFLRVILRKDKVTEEISFTGIIEQLLFGVINGGNGKKHIGEDEI